MRKHPLAVLAAASALCASLALAATQEKPGGAPVPLPPQPAGAKPEGPKPPPELDALSYFLGPWTFDGEAKPGPAGAGGPAKGREICRWMPGRFFLACMMETQGPTGTVEMQGMMGWDEEKKAYRWWTFDNAGHAESATGTLKDGTWTWAGESMTGGKTSRTRYTVTDTRPESYSFTLESSPDGKKWTVAMTGKAAKAMPRPAPTGGPRPPAGAPFPAPAPATTPTKSP